MVLILLLAVALLLSLVLGRLARMKPREIALQSLAMALAALGFYGLVSLL